MYISQLPCGGERCGSSLKLKLKMECMESMARDLRHPYIPGTTVLVHYNSDVWSIILQSETVKCHCQSGLKDYLVIPKYPAISSRLVEMRFTS